jgi:glyoxalase-like protein
MILGIDHLVIAVDDPDAAAAALETELGLASGGGGRHDALGTFNRLVWLGDSYLELIGVFDRELAGRGWFGPVVMAALERGGGLATWAIAVDDLDAQLRWAPEGSLAGPIEGERRRDDGRLVRWRLAHPSALSPTIPFLIEHDSTGAEWAPAEREVRAADQHPIGGRVRLISVQVETDTPAAAAARLRTVLSTSAERVGRAAIKVTLGPQAVQFAAPDAEAGAPATVELVADAAIRRRAARIGDCEIRVRRLPRIVSRDAARVDTAETDGAVRGD